MCYKYLLYGKSMMKLIEHQSTLYGIIMREDVIDLSVVYQYIFGSSNYAVKIILEFHWLSPPIARWEQLVNWKKPLHRVRKILEKGRLFRYNVSRQCPPLPPKTTANSMFFHINKKVV